MEKLDLDQLAEVSGGVGNYRKNQKDICYLCGKQSEFSEDSIFGKNSFGLGFTSVYDKDGEHKLCPSCYTKWCDEQSKNL